MAADPTRGRFVWYDLMTTDTDAAIDFYTRALGWGTAPFEELEEPYTMWTNNEIPLGGVVQLPEAAQAAGAPPHWLAYITSPDVDATVARAEELGARVVHSAMDIPTVGRSAILADPQGAVFAVYKPQNELPEEEGTPPVGCFSWHELATSDQKAAADFYCDLFGWDKMESMDMGPGGIYQLCGRNGSHLGGMFDKPAEMPGPPAWLYYVTVEDLEATMYRISDLGGTIVMGPHEVPGGDRIAQCKDPQGAFFAVHCRSKAKADA